MGITLAFATKNWCAFMPIDCLRSTVGAFWQCLLYGVCTVICCRWLYVYIFYPPHLLEWATCRKVKNKLFKIRGI